MGRQNNSNCLQLHIHYFISLLKKYHHFFRLKMKPTSYTPDGGTLKAQLAWRRRCIDALSDEEYKFVKTKNAWLHYYLGIRSVITYCLLLTTIAKNPDNILIWLPCAILQGQLLVNFIFLGHEGIHQLTFEERTPTKVWLEFHTARFWGWFAHTSMTYFKEYHGQHHHRFFRGEDDPKATHFVPKDGKLSTKLIYFSPGLISVLRSLKKNVKTVTKKTIENSEIDYRITRLAILLFLGYSLYFEKSFVYYLKIHFIPHLIFFPIFFMFNRCGQHYCCDPNHAALQSTPTKGGYISDVTFMYSQYHVEHHTFAEVPCYNLKYLNKLLIPRIYKKDKMPCFDFPSLVWGWLVQNRKYYEVWWDMASEF